MKLSIIIPTYNKADYLDKLLDSLLLQSFDASLFEVVVVNDGSIDHTDQIIKKYKSQFPNFRYVKQDNYGIGAARNAGVAVAKGDLVCFFADDYIVDRNYCASMVPLFDDENVMGVRADLGSVGSSAIEQVWLNEMRLSIWESLYGNNKIIKNIKFEPNLKQFAIAVSWCGGSMMRKSLFDKYGLFRTDLITGEDSEFGERLAKNNIYMHFNPYCLIQVAFRSGYVESLKRIYQYASNGRKIEVDGHSSTNKGLVAKALSFAKNSFLHTYIHLCLADTKATAVKMLPYLISKRIIILLAYLRG